MMKNIIVLGKNTRVYCVTAFLLLFVTPSYAVLLRIEVPPAATCSSSACKSDREDQVSIEHPVNSSGVLLGGTANVSWADLEIPKQWGSGVVKRVLSSIWSEQSYVNGGPSPLLIDTGRNGFQFGPAGMGVLFDLNADGAPLYLQWVDMGTDDAFLVRDIDQNGVIDDGSELFGSGTLLYEFEENASNGYQALAQFDSEVLGGNEDGDITPEDLIWKSLKLWIDTNANGYSESIEIYSLASPFDITSIDLNYKTTKAKRLRKNVRKDGAGNVIPYWSWVTTATKGKPRKMKMIDVFFASALPD